MKIQAVVFVLVCTVMVAALPNAKAGLLYGVDNVLHNLYTVDASTGDLTVVGPVGLDAVDSLALHPSTGVLYGIDLNTKSLVTIDTTTGASTIVGAQTLGDRRHSLAFDTDGNLYSLTIAPVDLVTIDLTTGVATSIGPNNGGFISFGGMSFSPDGTLYATDSGNDTLYTVDLASGNLTTVGTIKTGPQNLDAVIGLAFSPDGTLYGTSSAGNKPLVTIDTTTAAATVVANLGVGLAGLTYNVAIPESNTLTLAAFALLGLGYRRREQA
jgi:sugar lactone lactonase YvrE